MSGAMDYQTAYHQLHEGLLAFQQETTTDKVMQDKIKDISRIINADGQVKPATQEINQAKKQADTIVKGKQQEVQQLANKVKNYDKFIQDVQKNQIQLVSNNQAQTTISAPILKLNPTTKELISKQESPTTTYLALNE
jgi:hypothetical protein